MTKTKLNKALALAVAGTALTLAGISTASAHVAYNTYNAGASPGIGGTDGWLYGGVGNPNYVSPASFTVAPGWVGTASPSTNPFGYVGRSIANWAAELHTAGSSLTVSSANAQSSYGVQADIDTARGAWRDTGNGVPANAQGWAHNTDIGLFMAEESAFVTLKPSVVGGNGSERFGITVFTGGDTGANPAYTHHISWNSATLPPTNSNPFGTDGVSFLTYSDSLDSTTGLTFLATAGQVYSIYLGGVGGLFWNGQHEAYSLAISSAPVPVPAAVWLFGSALAGMGVIGRRKATAA